MSFGLNSGNRFPNRALQLTSVWSASKARDPKGLDVLRNLPRIDWGADPDTVTRWRHGKRKPGAEARARIERCTFGFVSIASWDQEPLSEALEVPDDVLARVKEQLCGGPVAGALPKGTAAPASGYYLTPREARLELFVVVLSVIVDNERFPFAIARCAREDGILVEETLTMGFGPSGVAWTATRMVGDESLYKTRCGPVRDGVRRDVFEIEKLPGVDAARILERRLHPEIRRVR